MYSNQNNFVNLKSKENNRIAVKISITLEKWQSICEAGSILKDRRKNVSHLFSCYGPVYMNKVFFVSVEHKDWLLTRFHAFLKRRSFKGINLIHAHLLTFAMVSD